MDKTIAISLTGHITQFRLSEAAYDRLSGYLQRAAARLQGDPDRAEVLGDFERSVGDKLAALVGPTDRLISAADIEAVLAEIGVVETGRDPESPEAAGKPRRRRLQRIHEGKEIAGVCTGLAAYAEIDVDWVRTVFILGTLVTAGILGIVYIALVLILPIAEKRES